MLQEAVHSYGETILYRNTENGCFTALHQLRNPVTAVVRRSGIKDTAYPRAVNGRRIHKVKEYSFLVVWRWKLIRILVKYLVRLYVTESIDSPIPSFKTSQAMLFMEMMIAY